MIGSHIDSSSVSTKRKRISIESDSEGGDAVAPETIEDLETIRAWLRRWCASTGPLSIEGVHTKAWGLVEYARRTGGVNAYDFVQILCLPVWGGDGSMICRYVEHERERLEADPTRAAHTARVLIDSAIDQSRRDVILDLDRQLSPRASDRSYHGLDMVDTGTMFKKHVAGTPSRLVVRSLRRMAAALGRHGYVGTRALVACLVPVATQPAARRLLDAIDTAVVAFLTLEDALGLVGTCRDIDHLRVFRLLPVVRFRFGTKGAKDATSRMRAVTLSAPCSAHVMLRGDVKDARLLEVLPVLTLPQPRAAVHIRGLHPETSRGLVGAMVGDGCARLRITEVSVKSAHQLLLMATGSKRGEPTARSRAVRSLALGVTLRDNEEGRGDKHALCVLLLRLFPNLVALDVWGPPTLPTEVDYDRAMSDTAPITAGQRDFPVYANLR